MSKVEQQGIVPSFGIFIVTLPFTFIFVITSFVGWVTARYKNNYTAVKWMSAPAWLILSNVIAGFFTLAVCFVLAFVDRDLGRYIFSNLIDLSGFFLWGNLFFVSDTAPSIPVWHIIVYQVVWYLILGHRIARQWTLALIDSSNVFIAREEDEEPLTVHRNRIESDPGYAKAFGFYTSRGTSPLCSLFSVFLSGCHPRRYFEYA